MRNPIFLFVFLVPTLLWAKTDRYDSGLLSRFERPATAVPSAALGTRGQSEKAALDAFLKAHFQNYPDFEWRRVRRVSDKTHVHVTYALYYQKRRVIDRFLKLHYQKKGKFVHYASSDWSERFALGKVPAVPQGGYEAYALTLKRRFQARYGVETKIVYHTEPVVWVDPRTKEVFFAVEVTAQANAPAVIRRHRIYEERTFRLLEDKPTLRHAVSGVKVYEIHPDKNSGALSTVTLSDLSSGASTLSDARLRVRREQDVSSIERVDVNPTIDFSTDGSFSASPYPSSSSSASSYDYTCDNGGGSPARCPNQEFNAVNVYYHASQFRSNVNTYLTTLGSSTSFSLDPIDMVVNTLSIDANGSGGSGLDDVNNAFYASTLTSGGQAVSGGIFFLRPERGTATACGSSPVQFFDLARESIVIAHEYMHYVTDKIANLVSGLSNNNVNVADALHEGYSDYFGASQITRLAGQEVTVIGDYAFKNCTAIQRDVGTLLPYEEGVITGAHKGGVPFASGLWQLRTELGREAMDLLVLKSLFFIASNPSFFDAIESLVKADQALNAGANVSRIRALFYNELNYLGAAGSAVFRDSTNYVVEVGFQSCSSSVIGKPFLPVGSIVPTLGLIGLWLMSLVWIGRKRWFS